MLHCALAGLDTVSEDSLFVTPDTLRATGVANFLHIRRESLRFLPAREAARLRRSPVIRRRSGVEKLEIDLRQPRFRLARRPVELVGVVELCPRDAGAGASLTAVGSRSGLARLRDSQPYAASLRGWRVFSRPPAACRPSSCAVADIPTRPWRSCSSFCGISHPAAADTLIPVDDIGCPGAEPIILHPAAESKCLESR